MKKSLSKDRRFHGSPYDRGGADSYYRRAYDPHWYPEGTYVGYRVPRGEMTPQELEEYRIGYEENEDASNFKDCR